MTSLYSSSSASSDTCEKLLCFLQSFNQSVYLFMGIIDVEAGSCRGCYVQPPVQGLGAMVARSHRDAVLVQRGAYIVRVYLSQIKGDHPSPVLGGFGAVDSYAVYLAQAAQRIGGQLDLVPAHLVHTQITQVVKARRPRDGVGDVGG